MARSGKGLFQRWGEALEKRRNLLCYALLLLAGFGALAGWALLPQQVALFMMDGVPSNFVDKNTALTAHLAISVGFTGVFFWRPREVVYFVAAGLGVLLTFGSLMINQVL